MGWLTHFEQQKIVELYGRHATYRCDREKCRLPIWDSEVPVVDPAGGYHPKPPGTPDFAPRQPKRTFHQHPCNDIRLGKRPPEPSTRPEKQPDPTPAPKVAKVEHTVTASKRLAKLGEIILETMRKMKKPKPEWTEDGKGLGWTVRACINLLAGKAEEPEVRDVVRLLKQEGKVIRDGHFLALGKAK